MTSGAFAAEQYSGKYIQTQKPIYNPTVINVKVNETFWLYSFHTTPSYDPNYLEIVKKESYCYLQGCIVIMGTTYQFKALKPGKTYISDDYFLPINNFMPSTSYLVTITP
ncbi:hypothetical protein [Methanobacterium sp. BAmetb5]|uniref:hypothetical protein n=1 Tax=Methanobacterium sp. BAmetb5 TaxID=2025351 RepID=UPI0025E714DA|nr:hypothetical protein [Methanobacterium sp. BAmetb5]